MESQVDLLMDSIEIIDRKKLIPLWIKIFSWIFFVLGFITPVGIIFGILGYPFPLALYGFQTNDALSIIGLLILFLFALKAVVAFGILFQKTWAVKLAIFDAILGIALCVFCMVYLIYYHNFSFRLEVVVLIPYLLKMQKIKPIWESAL